MTKNVRSAVVTTKRKVAELVRSEMGIQRVGVEKLAKNAGCSDRTIIAIRNTGNANFTHVLAVLDALGCKLRPTPPDGRG